MADLHFLTRRVGFVRLRQLADAIRHRLSFIPLLYVVGAIILVEALLLVDRSLTDDDLPAWLETTVTSARSVFASIAGGLITSITLLLSMMFVAVQLASSQFSPRTLRDWLGNRKLQHTVGLVLGTAVFSLLALRSTRDVGENSTPVVPHVTVLVAVALGVVALVAVVGSVDHLAHSVRIGSVAQRVASETIDVVGRSAGGPTGQSPRTLPSSDPGDVTVPSAAEAIESDRSGWVQQVDETAVLAALPPRSTAFIVANIGGFVTMNAPLLWIDPAPAADDPCRADVLDAFAIGDGRTMQRDVEFGLLQLADIAVRALSPGVNDPTSACDVTVHIGEVLVSIWEHEEPEASTVDGDRRVVSIQPTHASYLERAVGPIRRYGAADPDVMCTLLSTLGTVRSEVLRRPLPGPIEPLTAALAATIAAADREGWSPYDLDRFGRLSQQR